MKLMVARMKNVKENGCNDVYITSRGVLVVEALISVLWRILNLTLETTMHDD